MTSHIAHDLINVMHQRRRPVTYSKASRRPLSKQVFNVTPPPEVAAPLPKSPTALPKVSHLHAVPSPISSHGPPSEDIFEVAASDEECPLTTPHRAGPLVSSLSAKRARSNFPRNVKSDNVAVVLRAQVQAPPSKVPRKRKRLVNQGAEDYQALRSQTVQGYGKTEDMNVHAQAMTQPQSKILKRTVEKVHSVVASKSANPARPNKKVLQQSAEVSISPNSSGVASIPLLENGVQTTNEQASPELVETFNPTTPRRLSASSAFGDPATPRYSSNDESSQESSQAVSHTPRQAQIWRNLLADEGSDTAMTNLSRLRIGSTSKSKSRGAFNETKARRRRLVDSLMPIHTSTSSSDSESNAEVEMEDLAVNLEPRGCETLDSASIPSMSPNQFSQHASIGTEGRFKVTYARERSYLTDANIELAVILNQPLDNASPLPQSNLLGKAEVQPGSSAHTFSQPVDLEDEIGVRSIHELRAGSGLRKFQGEMDSILVEISGENGFDAKSTLSKKRSAWLELCKKLSNPEFKNQFIENGCERHIFSHVQQESDAIILTAIATALAFILTNEENALVSIQILEYDMFKSISGAFDIDRGISMIARDRQTNMSKVAQMSVRDIQESIISSKLLGLTSIQIVSPRLIALKCTELLMHRFRERGRTATLLPNELLHKIVEIANKSAIKKPEAFTSQDDLSRIELCLSLSILESCSIIPAGVADVSFWTLACLQKLIETLELAFMISTEMDLLVLRICLTIANSNTQISDRFATTSIIIKLLTTINLGLEALDTNLSQNAAFYDKIILALAALMNLVECSDKARLVTLHDDEHAIEKLIHALLKRRNLLVEADSFVETKSNVVYGLLAVVMGVLCQNPLVRSRICATMPNGKLDTIVDTIEEFTAHNEEADRREEHNDIWMEFTKRYRLVSKNLKNL